MPSPAALPNLRLNTQPEDLVDSQVPQSVSQEVCVLHHGALALGLDLVRPRDQRADRAGLLLSLRHDNHRLPLEQLPAPPAVLINTLLHLLALDDALGPAVDGQPAALGGQPGGHERRARQHKAYRAAVDAYRGERLGEAVDEAQVGEHDGPVGGVLLVEERGRVEDEEGVAVGQLHALEGALLGEHLIDVGRQERVCRDEGGAEGALGRRLELLLRGRLESAGNQIS